MTFPAWSTSIRSSGVMREKCNPLVFSKYTCCEVELVTEWIDPEALRVDWIAEGDVAGYALGEAGFCEDAEGEG